MKKLLLLLALFAISCEKKSEPFPIVVVSETLDFTDANYSFYIFTFRNEGDHIVDSFTVTIDLYENGFKTSETRTSVESLVPWDELVTGVVFSYHVQDPLDVTFKYKFK